MFPWMKRTAISLCLLTALAAPAWAAGNAPDTDVQLISAPVQVTQFTQLPSAVTVNGRTVAFDQGPALVDSVLMVPVRKIAEAAGGVVTWDGEARTVQVQMDDRTVWIRLDAQKAEMNQKGVYYFARNFIVMAKAPVLMNDRTLISVDALDAIFGFQVQSGPEGVLRLISPSAAPKPDPVPAQNAEQGTITDLKSGDRPSFLLSGAPMANGEPRLTWVSVTAATKITIGEGDQQRAGAVTDLVVGSHVRVQYAGPLEMSYPARGSAAEIVVSH